jgi:general stress protein 26
MPDSTGAVAARDVQRDAIETLGRLTRDIRVAMLTTTMPDGSIRARPMATPQKDFDGEFWFFTGWETEKVHELLQDQHVNLTFVKPEDNRYVSVSGRATIVRDRAKAQALWSPTYKAWFPKGVEDPNLALLRVRVEQAEYWDAPSSTMVQIAGFVKALVSGQRYEPGPGENEKLRL